MIICDVCKTPARSVVVPTVTNGLRDADGNIPPANTKIVHNKVIDCCQRCGDILLAKFRTALGEALTAAQNEHASRTAQKNTVSVGDDAAVLNAAIEAGRN